MSPQERMIMMWIADIGPDARRIKGRRRVTLELETG
jgi:hypothetical protein